MTKSIIAILSLTIIAIISCKKDSTDPGTNNNPSISSKDPVTLSKNIKIFHATHVQGSAPSPTGGVNAPSVTAPEDGVIHAFAGKYAVIKPTVTNGTIAGYYLGIEGAGEYFKLDYSKARLLEKKQRVRKGKNILGRPMDGEDSSIVVLLPTNIQTPDTFCITYCPYDSSGNIGEPVTTCIVVNKLGGDAASTWINGSWRVFAQSKLDNNDNVTGLDTLAYNSWKPAYPNSVQYYCVTDSSGPQSYITSYCYYGTCTPLDVKDSVKYIQQDFTINSDGSFNFIDSSFYRRLDMSNSTCSNYVFSEDDDYYEPIYGWWSIDGNKFMMIFEFEDYGSGSSDVFATEYTVQRISDNEFRLFESINTPNDYQIIFRKL